MPSDANQIAKDVAAASAAAKAAAKAAAGRAAGPAVLLPHHQTAPQSHGAAANGQTHIKNRFTVDPGNISIPPTSPSSPTAASATNTNFSRFAAFFLDPVKHKELINYLAVHTLFEQNTQDAYQDAQDEPINIAGSRIIEALPWVTYYEAVASNQKIDEKQYLHQEPQQTNTIRPWQEHYVLTNFDNTIDVSRPGIQKIS